MLFFADRFSGGSGIAGLAAATTAGNAATVPMLVAAANPAYLPAAGPATVLVAACVVITAIGCPIMVARYAKHLTATDLAARTVVAPTEPATVL